MKYLATSKQHLRNCFSLLLFSCLLFVPGSLLAQEKNVTGKISDEKNNPLPGVSVTVKGRPGIGTTSDSYGNFIIPVQPQSILLFESVGYHPKEMNVGSNSALTVILTTAETSLDNVVVIGYGTVRKKDLTGAVASIKGSDVKAQGVSDVSRSLQGRMPGVNIESSGGDPGSGTRIIIRGVGSLGNAAPLYIVDGVPVANIDNISPGDIESIDVLKDASAAAIYGSRAANGVVLITTKSGRSGKTEVQFNTNLGIQKIVKTLDVLNAGEWATVSNIAHDAAGLPRLEIAANPDLLGEGTNWQDAVYRAAPVQQYELMVSGGSAASRYSASGSYNDQKGIVDLTGYKRYNMRLKTETTKGRFKFGETVMISREKWITPGRLGGQGGNPVGSAAKMIPAFDIYNDTAVGGFGGAYGPVVNVANPVAQLHLNDVNRELTSILANAYGELTLIEGLRYRLNLGYTNAFGSNTDYLKRYEVGTLFVQPTNDLSQTKDQNVLLLLENTLNYDKRIGKHNIQALAGYTFQENKYTYMASARTNLPDGIRVIDAGAGISTTGGNMKQSDLISYLGRVIYSFDDRYLLTASFRRDGSSRFGRNNRYGNFPSVAVGWNISNERFFEPYLNRLSNLKLRAGYGVLGNQEIGDYQYSAAIASNINYVNGGDQQRWFGSIQTAFASPNIKWENTKTTNLGIDIGLLGNRINLTADYFVKETNDVLLNVPIPGSAGSVTNPVVNAGTLRNKGIEIGANYNGKAGGLNYSVYGTFSTVRNKVVELGTGSQQIFGGQPTHHGASTTVTQANGPITAFYLVKADGIFNSQEEVNAHNKNGKLIQPNAAPGDIRFFDANDDGKISDADRVYCGSPFPDFEYGFGVNASWNSLDLNVFLQGTRGNKIYNGLRQDLENTGLEFNYSKTTLNAWTPQNHSGIPRAIINDPNYNAMTSSRFLEDGSYLRIKTLQFGYTFSSGMIRKTGISSLRAYVSADNLFTITNYSGYNPDIGRSGTILDRGVDFGHIAYPLAKTFSLGFQLRF